MPFNRMRRKRLSPVDTAWLRMEDPTNLMMITGVFLFDEPLEFSRLKRLIEKRLLRYRRFRQRVVRSSRPFAPPFWEDDPNFTIDAHLHRIALPEPGDQTTLQNLVNDYMSMPLDFSKPLWQFHLVENFGTGCALLCRLHHCIADGIALMRVLLAMTDDQREPDVSQPEARGNGGHSGTVSGTGPSQSAAAMPRSMQRASDLFEEGKGLFSDPQRLSQAARFGVDSSIALARLLLLPPDPDTPLKGALGVSKRCAWSRPLDLDDVKAFGRVSGGTVNDTLLTAVSGALGRYLRRQGMPTGGLDFRAVVPVNLRPAEEELKLGNAFGLVFLSLPVGIQDPLDRLYELKRRMDQIKGTPEAIVAFGILTAIGAATSTVEDIVVKIFGTKATAVMTNVPGPQGVRYFAGHPIRGIMFWVPQSGRLGLGVSIISYNRQVLVGVATDAGLTPEPETIIEDFHMEFDDMMSLVRLARETDEEMEQIRQTVERCQATTKSGQPCRNRRLPGSLYCHVHQP